MTTQLAAPSLVEPTSRSSHSLTLLIDIPPEYNGDYRIQWYEAGYVYSSGWQSKVVAPHSAESVPTRSGWDSDGKPVFTGQAIYTLGDLAPNKCYVVRIGIRPNGPAGKWQSSPKSNYIYTLASDGTEGDLEKSLVLEQPGSIIAAPPDEDEDVEGKQVEVQQEQNSAQERQEDEKDGFVNVANMATSIDSLGSSDSDGLDEVTEEKIADPITNPPAAPSNTSGDIAPPLPPPPPPVSLPAQTASPRVEGFLCSNENLATANVSHDGTLLQEHAALKQEACGLLQENAALRQEVARGASFKRELAQAKNTAEQTENDLTSVLAQVQKLQQDLSAATQTINDQTEEIRRLSESNDVTQTLQTLKSQHAQALAEKENEMNDALAKALLDNKQDQIRLEASSAQLMQGQLHSMQQAHQDQTQMIQSLREELQQVSGQMNLTQVSLQVKENEVTDKDQQLALKNAELEELLKQLQTAMEASATPTAAIAPAAASDHAKLSFRSFNAGDIGLFMPAPAAAGVAPDDTPWIAFNHGCPHHYIAPEGLDILKEADGCWPSFFIGKIILKDSHTSSDQPNPFRLPAGTLYHTLYVEAF